MSAACWQRRRRNKYFRQAISYVKRHPDRYVVVGPVCVVGVDAARGWGILHDEN